MIWKPTKTYSSAIKMNYLLDRKSTKRKFIKIFIVAVFIFLLLYFKDGIFGTFSRVAHFIFRPALSVGQNAGEELSLVSLQSRRSLLEQNEILKQELEVLNAKLASYESILAENIRLREILGRKNENVEVVLANILSKPNRSPYDTLLIDAGANQGIMNGKLVLALGFLPIGRVAETFSDSAKVVLFSSPGQKTEVIISGGNIFLEIVGRGGGNFEAVLPRDMELPQGTEAMLPGANGGLIGMVETTISDPRDAFKKVLLSSPVNIQELKFVQVER